MMSDEQRRNCVLPGRALVATARLIIILSLNVYATAAQTPPSATPNSEAQLLELSKPIERQLGVGELHAYKVLLEAGMFLDAAVNQRGVDVMIRLFAPDGTKIADIDSPNGKKGDEPITLEAKTAGVYRIEVTPLEKVATTPVGSYEIRINEILSPAEYASRLADKKRKQDAVVAALRTTLIPIKSVEAVGGFADLQPLKRVLKDARFVGLGEETHGTREFFQFKHRMVEFLVKEMGFRVFAIEASYSACRNINDYISGKMNDGEQALASQGFWTWNTQEVKGMLDWMRNYNATVPADRRIEFVGFDIQANDTGKAKLLEYLKRVAPDRVADTEAFFKIDMNALVESSFFAQGEAAKDARMKLRELKSQYNDLLAFLEIGEPLLTTKSNQAEYEQMREYARVLAQYIDVYSRANLAASLRDVYMADNLRRIINREPAGTRFVIWAHNQHIVGGGRQPSLGSHLRDYYGDEYYAVGFSFNQGSFQAMQIQPNDPTKTGLVSFTVNPAPVDSIDWYLAETKAKIGFIDLHGAAKNKVIADWISVPHPMRAIGAVFDANNEKQYAVSTVLKSGFDGLFFVDTTTRARPIH